MNLWAKSLRQLSFVAVALFFFSCEDENSILGFKNPVPKFNVSFVEIPLTSSSLLIDSTITDNKNGAAVLLLGKYKDSRLGNVQAQSYLQIYPAQATQIPSDALFDSLTISLRYNFYGYGFTGETTEKFAIHELTDSLDRRSVFRYRFNHPGIAYNPTPMATASVKVHLDSLIKQSNLPAAQQDTLVARARLSDELGRKIFNLSKQYNFISSSTLSANVQYREFLNAVRGIALIPTESNGILGIRILNNFSAVTVHYRTLVNGAVKDTLSRTYGFNIPSFTKIDVERSGTEFSGAAPYQNISAPSSTGIRYVQSGNPVVTKIDLSNFYAFADTVGNVLVNEASIVIDGVESPPQAPAISELALKIMNGNNQFTNYAVAATDRAAMVPYNLTQSNQNGVLIVDGKHYFVKQEFSAEVAALRYSSGRYGGNFTLFFQELLKYSQDADGINETRLNYLGLYPLAPPISNSVSRTVFNAENLKLRIYYTKPTLTTTPN